MATDFGEVRTNLGIGPESGNVQDELKQGPSPEDLDRPRERHTVKFKNGRTLDFDSAEQRDAFSRMAGKEADIKRAAKESEPSIADMMADAVVRLPQSIGQTAEAAAERWQQMFPERDIADEIGGFDAFITRDQLTRADTVAEQKTYLKEKFGPTTLFRTVQNEKTGEAEISEVRLPPHVFPVDPGEEAWLPIDKANSFITGMANPGDLGDAFGNVVTAVNVASVVAAKKLPFLAATMFPRGKAVGPVLGGWKYRSYIPKWRGTDYMQNVQNQILNGTKSLGRITTNALGAGAVTSGGKVMDESWDWAQGFQEQDLQELAADVRLMGITDAGLEGGMRAAARIWSTLLSPVGRRLFRGGADTTRSLMSHAAKWGLSYIPAEMHVTFRTAIKQSSLISATVGQNLVSRDVAARAGIREYFRTLGDPTRYTKDELAAGLEPIFKRITKSLVDPTTEIMSSKQAKDDILSYFAYQKRNIDNWANAAADSSGGVGKETFDLKPVQAKIEQIRRSGVRVRGADEIAVAGGRTRGEGGRLVPAHEVGELWKDPIHPDMHKLMAKFDAINPLISDIGSGKPDLLDLRKTSVGQMVDIYREALSMADDVTRGYNGETQRAASELFHILDDVFHTPANASSAFKDNMTGLSKALRDERKLADELWVRKITGFIEDGSDALTPEDWGTYIINLDRPTILRGVKKAITDQPNGIQRWQEFVNGHTSRILGEGPTAHHTLNTLEPRVKESLELLYTPAELRDLKGIALEMSNFMHGATYRLLKSSIDDGDVVLNIIKSRDTKGLALLVEQWGGKDTPQARQFATTMFMHAAEISSSSGSEAVRYIDRGKLVARMTELHDQGFFDVLLSDSPTKDINKMMQILGHQMGSVDSNVGSSIIAGEMAQGVIKGMSSPTAAIAKAKVLLQNFIFGRMLFSPTAFRLAGLPSPISTGILKHDRSFLREYVKMVKHIRLEAHEDSGVIFQDDVQFPIRYGQKAMFGLAELVNFTLTPTRQDGTERDIMRNELNLTPEMMANPTLIPADKSFEIGPPRPEPGNPDAGLGLPGGPL